MDKLIAVVTGGTQGIGLAIKNGAKAIRTARNREAACGNGYRSNETGDQRI